MALAVWFQFICQMAQTSMVQGREFGRRTRLKVVKVCS